MNKKGAPIFPGMRYCTRCCMPETEEGIDFDELGICKLCRSSEQKMHIDWTAREAQLRRILEDAKARAGDAYDCLLPVSGGKDSTFQAHILVNVYKMKPLAVTFNHNWFSETGWYNLMNMLETFNLDHIMFTPNRSLVNRLAKRSLEMIGDACWNCHSGGGAFPHQVAARFKIPLLVYGESASEAHGMATYAEPIKHDRHYFTKVSAKKTPDEMVGGEISAKDVYPYQLPTQEECECAGVMGIHLGDYLFWDHERQTEFVRDTYGWRETQIENSYKHYKSAECIMPGIHDFTCYLKRGFGRGTTEAAMDVRSGLLTREEAFRLVHETDPIRPEVLDYYLQITGYTEEEFYQVMRTHRKAPLAGGEIPILPKSAPHGERLLPYPVQLIERLRSARVISGGEAQVRAQTPGDGVCVQDDIFLSLPISRILRGYRKGEFSPVDVARASVRRILALDEQLGAFESFDPDILLEQAAAREQRLATGEPIRPLEGIPVAIKDTFNTEDYPTQMGSRIWEGYRPGNDARTVFSLRQAGAVVAGKSVTAEFAVHALGKTKNPHDPVHTPGTSSSGSAAAIAAGMVPVATGSQTAGSISRPASFCGIYGFKPSFGLLPRTGTLKTTDSLDTLGYFTTFLEDIPRLFDVLRVRGSNYPLSDAPLNDPARQTKASDRPWKVAFLMSHVWKDAPGYARRAMLDWVDALAREPGIEIVELSLPEGMSRSHEIHATIYDRALAYYFQQEARSRELISPVMREIIERGETIDAQAYTAALNDQEELITAMDTLMSGFDAAICLGTAGVAPPRDQEERPDPSLMWTMTHLPTLSVPVFAEADLAASPLPFGAQIVARKYNDPLLFSFALELLSRGLLPAGPNPCPQFTRKGA
ncbi:MAG: N-acetyl sugar [Desulfovibrionaceae bacterium]|nr:MAG: N-acetyl sugar [Desulfovibrionaceae bacterium]